MKATCEFLGLLIVGVGLFNVGCAPKQPPLWQSIKNPEVTAQLKSFVAAKEAQARAGTNDVSVFQAFFAAAEKGDWLAINNIYNDLKSHAPQYDHPHSANDERLNGPCWQLAKEIWGAFDAFGEGDEKCSTLFSHDVIESIPPGSIYFGGTDPGRFLVTAMQKSHANGDPFYGLTQNVLADGTYLDYVRCMYGDKIYVPGSQDLSRCYDEYTEDVKKRSANHQLKPGENVQEDSNGHVQISGEVAVMEINGLLCKIIFDKNPDREFYIEESFPLDWMYPYLEPHGLIFKLNRQPLSELSDEMVRRDHDYWTNCLAPMIGNWLNDDTPVADIAAFAERVFLRHDFSGFTGDPRFVQNDYAYKTFSKERSSIAGLYAWRAQHATDTVEKERMDNEADFAFRQAWALCPYSPEAVFRYVNLLLGQRRIADALVVAETAAKFPSTSGREARQFQNLVDQLKRSQKAK